MENPQLYRGMRYQRAPEAAGAGRPGVARGTAGGSGIVHGPTTIEL